MFRQHPARERLYFAESHSFEAARTFKAKAKAANARKKIEYAKFFSHVSTLNSSMTIACTSCEINPREVMASRNARNSRT